MNFFDANITPTADGLHVGTDAFELVLPSSTAERLSEWDGDHGAVELGIRPETFADAALVEGTVEDGTTLEARVMVVEPMGPHKDLALRPLGAEDDETTEFTARVSNDTGAVEGETVRLAVATGSVHLFDRATGENLLVDR